MKKSACIIRSLIITILFVVPSCTGKKADTSSAFTFSKEINDVITTLIESEGLYERHFDRKTFILESLTKLQVRFDGNYGGMLPRPPKTGYTNYQLLLADSVFSKSDSSFFDYQNSLKNNFVFKKSGFTANPESDLKTNTISSERNSIIRISVPIFSTDHNKAFVQVDLYCLDAGYGKVYFMIKENNKWRIKLKYRTWIS